VTGGGWVDWQSNCTFCHGTRTKDQYVFDANPRLAAPPDDVTGRLTGTSGAAVGAHQAHLSSTLVPTAMACTECHAAVSDLSHVDLVASVTFGEAARARSGGATPAWTSSAGTCSGTYCHGATLPSGPSAPPVWNATAADRCALCHGNPPPAPHPANTACGSCHSGYGSKPASGPQAVHAASHLNGVKDVGALTCASCHGEAGRTGADASVAYMPPRGTRGETATSEPAVGAHEAHVLGGGVARPIACTACHALPTSMGHANGVVDHAWSALAAGAPALPAYDGTPRYDRTARTCTNYCHGATLAGGALTVPVWTAGASQAACGSCHGNPPPAPHPSSTACSACHAGYGDKPASGPQAVQLASHVNGAVDVLLTCTSCHGQPGRTGADPDIAAMPPNGTRGETATTQRAVGAHAAHLAKGVACTDCHARPTLMAHADGVVNFSWSPFARTNMVASPTFNPSTLRCSNYCHGATLTGGSKRTPLWTGGAAEVGCGTCHGNAPRTYTHEVPSHYLAGGCTTYCHADAVHLDGTVHISCNSEQYGCHQ
jgi:predicted CxxxxCH...CXXCH cytochrome family protein